VRLFQFRSDEEFFGGVVVFDAQDVRLAANLAVFDVGLAPSGRGIDGGNVPFSARGALEARFHFSEDSTEFAGAAVEYNSVASGQWSVTSKQR
jgi:hypothetical protein